MSDRVKNKIFYLVIAFIFCIGFYLRILFFSYGRPFWNDESALALNLINRSFFQLFQILDYEQVSPPLYVCFAKIFGFFMQKYEYAYRLPALICSFLSIPVFFVFCKKFLEKKISVIFAMILFVLNYQLLYYSQELKQYSADVLVFLLILLFYFYIDLDRIKKWQLFGTGLFFSLLVWFSYTAVFGIISLFFSLILKDFKKWRKFLILFCPFVFSLFLFWIFRHNLSSSEYLHLFWEKGFISKNFSNVLQILSHNLHFYFLNFSNKFFIYLTLLVGMIAFVKNIKHQKNVILFFPVLLAFILSYFNIYPLYDRVSIYLSSILFLIMAKSFDLFDFKIKIFNYFLYFLLFMHFGLNLFYLVKSEIIDRGYYAERTPEFLKIAESKIQKGDVLYVSAMTHINYKMYKDTVSINNVIVETVPAYDFSEYSFAINKLQTGKTYYLLMTHSGDKMLEYNNLKEIMKKQKDVVFMTDDSYNLLIKFTKI